MNKERSIARKLVMMIFALMLFVSLASLGSAEGDQSFETAIYRITQECGYYNESGGAAENLSFSILVLDNRSSGWASQTVLEENVFVNTQHAMYEFISTESERRIRVSMQQGYRLYPGQYFYVRVTQLVKVSSIDSGITRDDVHGEIPEELWQYTQPTGRWESDNPTIAGKAHELTDNYPNYYDKAKRIFDFVRDHMTYQHYGPEQHTALWAYNSGYGVCRDFSNLFIALCRAAGIPADYVCGPVYEPGDENLDNCEHAWTRIYLPNVGWVPVEVTWNDFCKLDHKHITEYSGDPDLLLRAKGYPYTYHGTAPTISWKPYWGTIQCEAGMQVYLYPNSYRKDNSWSWYLFVKNMGRSAARNVRVRLQADPTYFEIPPAQTIGTLHQNENTGWLTFDVGVKEAALGRTENFTVTAMIDYDSDYGPLAETVCKSAQIPESIPSWEFPEIPVVLIVIRIVIAATGGVIILSLFIFRRNKT